MFSLITRCSAKTCHSSVLNYILLKSRTEIVKKCLVLDYSNFTTRDFMFESLEKSGSLFIRFAKHLAKESYKFDKLIPTKIRYADFFPVVNGQTFYNELMRIETNQLPYLIIYTFTYKTNGDPMKLVKVINDIDSVCTQRLNEMDIQTIIKILYSFLFLMPTQLTKADFYEKSAIKLVKDFTKDLTKEEFVNVCFYLGLMKKKKMDIIQTDLLKNFLESHLKHYVNELSVIDLGIVANASFKTSVLIADNDFNKRLIEESLKLSPNEDALLINFIKSLRFNRITSEDMCKKLSEICNSPDIDQFQFKGLVHIFAYFAENLWDETQICSTLINRIMQLIRQPASFTQKDEVRLKDICTFIMCCAHLDVRDLLQENDLNFLESSILKETAENRYFSNPDLLVDSCLSLWNLGKKSRQLVDYVLGLESNLGKGANKFAHVKLASRKNVLWTTIKIEKPEWLTSNKQQKSVFDDSVLCPDYILKNHPALMHTFKLWAIGDKEISSIKTVCPIKDINVPSILIELNNREKYFFEILEKNQLLRFSTKPTSINRLKLKLLKNFVRNVIVLRHDEVKSLQEIMDTYVYSSDENNEDIAEAKSIRRPAQALTD